MTELLAAALAVAATGLPVFPCGADKAPVCAGGFKAATIDPGRIRSLFSHSAARLIGMPTGPASGLIVIDIDKRHGGLEWLAAHEDNLPATRRHSTMSGGVHLVFRDGGHGIRNSAGRLGAGVDVRGDGGYICAPPSPGYAVTDAADVADMPAWAIERAAVPVAAPAPIAPRPARPATALDGGSPYGIAGLQNECDAIRQAYDGSKHATINRAGYAVGGLVGGGELPEREAFAALTDALNAIAPRCKDFRAAEKVLRRAFDEGRARPRDVPEMAAAADVDLSNIAEIIARHAPENGRLQGAAAAAPLPIPVSIMDLDGALKLFVDYCEATAISRQPFLALAAAITAIGALAGRKYRTKTNLRTNIYAVGVADSGGGKDHARQKLKEIFCAGGLTEYLGGEDIASGTAMMTALARHPAVLFQIDEFGDWLGNVLGPKSAPHKKEIAQKLKTLYSAAGTFLSGTEYADQSKTGRPREDIQQPHACLYGTTTPGQFWRAIATASMEDGTMARFLVFVSADNYPDKLDPEYIEPPATLVAAFKAIAAGPGGGGNLAGVMAAGVAPAPMLVEMTADADAAYKALRAHETEKLRKNAGTSKNSIGARLTENAIKLALVKAVSRNPAAPRIAVEDMAWGRALAEHCIDTLLKDAEEHVATGPYAINEQAALKIIKQHSAKGITEYEMVRAGWKVEKRTREEILGALEQGGRISKVAQHGGKNAGRSTFRFHFMN